MARVIIAQQENECTVCPLRGPGHDSSVGVSHCLSGFNSQHQEITCWLRALKSSLMQFTSCYNRWLRIWRGETHPPDTGCHAAFLQVSTTSSEEGCRLNLQIQHSRRILNASIATTAHTSVEAISSKQSLTQHQLYPTMLWIYRRLVHRSGSIVRLFSHSADRT